MLIAKWRGCAQKLVERMFVEARNRIDRMGGFKDYLKRQGEITRWDDQESRGDDGEIEDHEDTWKEDQEDEVDEFTMEYMLKMAGVEEGLIGWDRGLNNFKKC